MAAHSTPRRIQDQSSRHYSTLLREIKSLAQKFDALKTTIASTVRAELENHDNRSCLAIYGLPENEDQVKKVNSILALACLAPTQFTILHRLGKPRLDGLPRPLKVKLLTSTPRLIDLSQKMRADSLMYPFHVRLFESPDQRRAGFLARQRQRDAAQEPLSTPDKIEIPRTQPIDIADSPLPQQETPKFDVQPIDTTRYESPVHILPSVPISLPISHNSSLPTPVSSASSIPVTSTITHLSQVMPHVHIDSHLKSVFDACDHLYSIRHLSVSERYAYFRQLKCSKLMEDVAKAYYSAYGFKFGCYDWDS